MTRVLYQEMHFGCDRIVSSEKHSLKEVYNSTMRNSSLKFEILESCTHHRDVFKMPWRFQVAPSRNVQRMSQRFLKDSLLVSKMIRTSTIFRMSSSKCEDFLTTFLPHLTAVLKAFLCRFNMSPDKLKDFLAKFLRHFSKFTKKSYGNLSNVVGFTK